MRTDIGTLVIPWLVLFLQTSAASELPSDSPAKRALQFFAGLPMTTIERAFQSLRPEPIRTEEKQRALATLSGEGELRPNAREAAKLESLRRVLIYHKREDVFEVKVIDLPQAAVVLYARSICYWSRDRLFANSRPWSSRRSSHMRSVMSTSGTRSDSSAGTPKPGESSSFDVMRSQS